MDGTKELIPKNIITVDEELDEFSNRPVANKTLFKKFQESAGMQNPMTTAGDIIVGDTSGAPSRLAKGNEGDVLAIGSDGPEWTAPSGGVEIWQHKVYMVLKNASSTNYSDLNNKSISCILITNSQTIDIGTVDQFAFSVFSGESNEVGIRFHGNGSTASIQYQSSGGTVYLSPHGQDPYLDIGTITDIRLV